MSSDDDAELAMLRQARARAMGSSGMTLVSRVVPREATYTAFSARRTHSHTSSHKLAPCSPPCPPQTALRKQVDDAEPQPAEPPRPSVDAEPSDYEDDDGPSAELRAHFPASFGGARWPVLGPGRDMRLPSLPACP